MEVIRVVATNVSDIKEVIERLPRNCCSEHTTAFGLIVFTAVGVALLNIIDSIYLQSLEVLLTHVVVLLIVAMDLLLLFAPAVYIGRKYELVYGFLTFAATITFLLVLVLLLATFFAIVRQPIINYF
jgi:hypothetical protein